MRAISLLGVAIALPLALGACSLMPGGAVRSDAFPGVTITCGGDEILPVEDCRAWGERLLAGMPEVREVARVELTYNRGNRRCAADFFDARGRMAATAAAVCPVRAGS